MFNPIPAAARAALKRQNARNAGHRAGVAFFMALFRRRRGEVVCVRRKISDGNSRAEIRKIVARGEIIDAPFAGEDETRQRLTRAKRQRRQRAILAQHARRFGLHDLSAKKFGGRNGD